jgi:hypothetical protein
MKKIDEKYDTKAYLEKQGLSGMNLPEEFFLPVSAEVRKTEKKIVKCYKRISQKADTMNNDPLPNGTNFKDLAPGHYTIENCASNHPDPMPIIYPILISSPDRPLKFRVFKKYYRP